MDSAGERTWIGSTGIMLFRKEALDDMFEASPRARSFGTELVPELIRRGGKVRVTGFACVQTWFRILGCGLFGLFMWGVGRLGCWPGGREKGYCRVRQL
jgi:hypothetical protein